MTRPLPTWSELRESPAARRAFSLTLTVLAHVLILLALLRTTAFTFLPPAPERNLVAVDIAPVAKEEARQARAAPTRTPRTAPPPSPIPPPPPAAVPPPEPWVINPELAGFDLRRAPRRDPGPAAPAATEGSDSESAGSVYGPTTEPGGGRLFAAEWYREPTDAELGFYMPRGVIGWGAVACRTVERFHVEDCREIGESPPGSRIASGIREAAWQFLVRPPRINGKAMVGAWVRIRIDLTPNGSRPR